MDCPGCGASNKPEAKFCIGCGKENKPPAITCPKCDRELPDQAKFCDSCGSSTQAKEPEAVPEGTKPEPTFKLVEEQPKPEPPTPEPKPEPAPEPPKPGPKSEPVASPAQKKSSAGVWIFLLLLLGGGGAAAFFLMRPVEETGRLIAWAKEATVTVEGATPQEDGTWTVMPGEYLITVTRAGKEIERGRVSVVRATTSFISFGAEPVAISAEGLTMTERYPVPGPLHVCRDCKRMGSGKTCASCGKSAEGLATKTKLKISAAKGLLDEASDRQVVLVSNPYPAGVRVNVSWEGGDRSFDLAATSGRPVGLAEGMQVALKTEFEGETISDQSATVPAGVSLLSVGGTTCYRWLGKMVAPADIAEIKLDAGQKVGRAANAILEGLEIAWSMPLLAGERPEPRRITVFEETTVRRVSFEKPVTWLGPGPVVVSGGDLFDLRGNRLGKGTAIESATRTGGSILGMSRQGRLVSLEGDRWVEGPELYDATIRVWSDGSHAYLFGGRSLGGFFVIGEEFPDRLLPNEPEVTALGFGREGMLVARGRHIGQLKYGKVQPVLVLPAGDPILGLHDAGGTLIFSTRSAVYALVDDVVLPIATGLGGPLVAAKEGILLHDDLSGALFQIRSPLFKE